ncbi:MAG TPA: nucleoside hydrolase [Woeseiaceae bacterium]|nr:nucleoside hydrolase [Woeseiaceae bacterium]
MREIIIDCDPGQDDAVALLLALAYPETFEIIGITAVAGNVPLSLTERNARIICDLAKREDTRVFAGCAQPMKRALCTAEAVHGKTGIDGIEIFEPETPLEEAHAVDFIIEALLAAPAHSVTLVPTGPLTNIATAIEREPGVLEHVDEIVLMGGAMREGGNFSPSAEFNILVDPHAADIVFRCGRPITAMGLDVTHQVLSTRERVAAIRALKNPVADAVAGMLSFFHRHDAAKYGSEGAPLHDPCTIAYLLQPELFAGRQCNVSVETESELTIGHTAVDFWHVTDRPINTNWIYQVDAHGFYSLLNESLARYSESAA